MTQQKDSRKDVLEQVLRSTAQRTAPSPAAATATESMRAALALHILMDNPLGISDGGKVEVIQAIINAQPPK